MNTGGRMMITRLAMAAAGLALAAGTAMAQPGPAAGRGPGGGPGYGFGPNNTPGWSLMTEQERNEHRDRMHSFKSYEECKAYMTDFGRKMQDRAKEKGSPARGPSEFACDRMKERGFFR